MSTVNSILLCLCFSYPAFSQIGIHADYIEVKGILTDTLTTQPIASAHIWTRHFNSVSNADGSFSILALPNDSIHFSHVNYHLLVVSVRSLKNSRLCSIMMKQKVTLLNSVDVFNILSEESFKRKILTTTKVETTEEQNAKENIAALNYYIRSLPQLPMNANDNYRDFIKGPQGVTIFSSSGQKGLIKAIRDVAKSKPVPYKNFLNRIASPPVFNFPLAADSSKIRNSSVDTLKIK